MPLFTFRGSFDCHCFSWSSPGILYWWGSVSTKSRSKSLSKKFEILDWWLEERDPETNLSNLLPVMYYFLPSLHSSTSVEKMLPKKVSVQHNPCERDPEKRSKWLFFHEENRFRIRFQHYLVHQPLNFISIMMTWVMICWTLNYQFYFSYMLCFYYYFFFWKADMRKKVLTLIMHNNMWPRVIQLTL